MSAVFGKSWRAACAAVFATFAIPSTGASPAAVYDNGAIAEVLASVGRSDEPGCVAAASRDGETMHVAAVGLADVAARKHLSADTVFNIASVSKQFTAFAALLLDQRRALSLDDPIVRYVPELADSAHGVTIRHLIHHTGGLRDYAALLELQGRRQADAVTREQTIDILRRQRSANTPAGVAYEYSNTGYFLLSVIIERVSQQSLAEFSARNIFEPLGMSSTSIVDRYPSGIAELARGYASAQDGGYAIRESVWEQTGDGQVHSTVGDLLLWARNFTTGRVGSAVTKRMLEPGVLASGERLSYAAGLSLEDFQGQMAIAHRGTVAGYRAYLMRIPAQAFSVAVLCNRNDVQTNEYAVAIAQRYVEHGRPTSTSSQQPSRRSPRSIDISQVAGGWYRDQRTAKYLSVSREGQTPRLNLDGTELSIRRVDDSGYRIAELGNARLTFVRSPGDSGTQVQIKAVPFHALFSPAAGWVDWPLDGYAATYRSDEIGAQITVRVIDGQPTAVIAGQSESLQRGIAGELRAAGGGFVLRFEPAQAPQRLYYFTHGVHGLPFERRR